MTDQELHAFCQQYGQWCRTRRLLAPPVPSSVLARLQPRRRVGEVPDASMDARMSFFNMAVHALADEDPESGMCFTLYHVYGFRPVKQMAAALGIGTRTFYDRLNRHSRRAHILSKSIERAHHLGIAIN
ncbi:hypothetical protein [Pandoraea sputorum]|uniref:hypothetical protein n=1 Tax=Pandoraea sputorum TaxID=93222 RepID=UPI0012400E8F|nr:hypothetical protein [Pandoraea sputorum]VVE78158.1 hypothetical protein PSP31120_01536 [Pandoraea sputorum]